MSSRFFPLATTTWDTNEYDSMQRVIASGQFTMGAKVKAFEERFANFFGAKYAVMSNSGSSANLLAVAAMRYSKNQSFDGRDEIIVPAVSWSTTYYPVSQLGFKLRFVDIDLPSLNMGLESIRAAINEKTAGIFAVNLLGNPAPLAELADLARRKGIFLIEDNCESMGATIDGKFAGTFGEIGTFSTFFSHHISTMEGGVCVTDDLELAQIMTSMRAHGWTRELPDENEVHNKSGDAFEDSFRFVLPGYNLRPLELSGALGLEQLKKVPAIVDGRRKNAQLFRGIFSSKPYLSIQQEHGESSWFGFALILRGSLKGRRNEVVAEFAKHEIDSRPIVAGNFALNPVLKHLNHAPLPELQNATYIHQHGLFVGNHDYDLTAQLSKLEQILDAMA